MDALSEGQKLLNEVAQFDRYVTWIEGDQLKNDYKPSYLFFKNSVFKFKKEPLVKEYIAAYEDLNSIIDAHNKRFVASQKQIHRLFFDAIEGKKLDDQQRTAVLTDEYSNLIIAGAGSGKTLTIIGKVLHLTRNLNISPTEILLLSFTKKTVTELNERISTLAPGLEATTFHKLGYKIIQKYVKSPPVVTNENTLANVIAAYFKKDIIAEPEALQAFVEYVACYLNIPEDLDYYGSLGEKLEAEKGIDFRTLKSKCEPVNKEGKPSLDTLQGERVKSVEELVIANFLYLNGIEYEYEKKYPYGDVVYRPDFYLTDYHIYLEHFGVDENNRAKWLSELNEKKYLEEMVLKRKTHETYGTKLIETYSYYNRDNMLLQKLEEMLKDHNVTFRPKDPEKIYQSVTQNDPNFGSELNKLVESVINLSKSNGFNEETLRTTYLSKSSRSKPFLRERQDMFLKFALRALAKYNSILAERNEIDFNDMINQATQLVQQNKSDFHYRYVIIDEYQDISVSRFNLVLEIREASQAKMICVGDDWQSIYRFAGSDVSLFRNFEKFVGQSEILLIEQTYRNSKSLINISTKFIQKNPLQIKKQPKSVKEDTTEPVKFIRYTSDRYESTFVSVVQQIAGDYPEQSILVIGRHRFDINALISSSSSPVKYIERSGMLLVDGVANNEIKYITAHQSKGIEADNVIILNVQNNLLGFPNKLTDDPILAVLLNDAEEFLHAEERRLFYVALTRTKNNVFLMVPEDASTFAQELLFDNHYLLGAGNGAVKQTHCPYCKKGVLLVRENQSTGNRFLGCSNFPSCNQTFNSLTILEDSILCDRCESGFMVNRTGIYGNFLGCTCYPLCKNTIKLN